MPEALVHDPLYLQNISVIEIMGGWGWLVECVRGKNYILTTFEIFVLGGLMYRMHCLRMKFPW
jgi:hypothetical protein